MPGSGIIPPSLLPGHVQLANSADPYLSDSTLSATSQDPNQCSGWGEPVKTMHGVAAARMRRSTKGWLAMKGHPWPATATAPDDFSSDPHAPSSATPSEHLVGALEVPVALFWPVHYIKAEQLLAEIEATRVLSDEIKTQAMPSSRRVISTRNTRVSRRSLGRRAAVE